MYHSSAFAWKSVEAVSVFWSTSVSKKSLSHSKSLLLVYRTSWSTSLCVWAQTKLSSPGELSASSLWQPVTFKNFSFLPCYLIERFASTSKGFTVWGWVRRSVQENGKNHTEDELKIKLCNRKFEEFPLQPPESYTSSLNYRGWPQSHYENTGPYGIDHFIHLRHLFQSGINCILEMPLQRWNFEL